MIMTRERAIELLRLLTDDMMVGESISNVIEKLLEMGFTKEELVEDLYFNENDISNIYYYDIHVNYGKKDSDGYSIFIKCKTKNIDKVIQKAVDEDRFEFSEDIDYIDYIDQITKQEYIDATGKEV